MAAALFEPVLPSDEDIALARTASRGISRVIHPGRRARLQEVNGAAATESIEVPAAAVRLIQRLLEEMAKGNAVAIIPIHAELTTQQAADVLGASRPFVIKLLESGELPCRMVGTHRRVRYTDLMDYKNRIAAERQRVLDELAADAQDLDESY